MELQFIGATDDVTGSMCLLESLGTRILIDCGLHQGIDSIVKKNLDPLPFNPKEITAIILTHAHLDHTGYIPHLVKLGFRGPIYGTEPTLKLALIIMNDSARIIQKNKMHLLHSFYDTEDVDIARSLFISKNTHDTFHIGRLSITLTLAGHILGASSIVIQGEKKIIFSGDLGRQDDYLMFPPEACPKTDVLVIESTYGGKIRKGNFEEELSDFLLKLIRGSKVGIIASFAVARAQLLIVLIRKFNQTHPDEKIHFVIDGPMMTAANNIYNHFAFETKLNEELKKALNEVEIIDHPHKWESLQKAKGPLVIVTSSGMISGGRIWRYLENWQHDRSACLFLPGHQASGTPGKAILEGQRIIYNEEGKKINWSGEVFTSEAFSSHADQNELLYWLKDLDKKTHIFINHGEQVSKNNLNQKLIELGYNNVTIAEHLKVYKENGVHIFNDPSALKDSLT